MKNLSFGNLKIFISAKDRNRAMNSILVNNLTYKKAKFLDDLSLEILIRASDEEKFTKALLNDGIEIKLGNSDSFLARISKYRHRWGIICGILIMLFSVYFSSLFIWRIDVEGNESVSKEEILEILEESGCALGEFIPKIDYDKLHNEFLIRSSDISWISVNITGNVAKVCVRERMQENNENGEFKYSNVVARADAQIASIQIYNGKKAIAIGDVVKKGDLLVSGVIDSQSQGVRYVHADAIVMAYTNKPIFIKIPYANVKKVYTGNTYTHKTLKFFSKTINFSLKYRNYTDVCDKIETNRKIRIFGSIELPIEVQTTLYREYEMKEVAYSKEQAIDIAFSALRQELDNELKNAELISKSVKTYYDEDFFYIDCNLYCLENISSVVEFEVN